MSPPDMTATTRLDDVEVHFINRTHWPVVGGVERQFVQLQDLVRDLGGRVVIWTGTRLPASAGPSGRRPPGAVATRPDVVDRSRLSPRLFLVLVVLRLVLYRARHPRRRCVILAGRASAEAVAALLVKRLFGDPVIVYLAGGDERGSEFSTQRRGWLQSQMVQRVDVFVAHTASYLDEVKAAGHRGARLIVPTITPVEAGPGCPVRLPGDGAIRVLWCGRNHAVKGLERLARMVVGPMKAAGVSLTAISDEQPPLPPDCVVHTGCPDPRSHMAEFDAIVLTSRYEGQPNVMAEAALEGVPTIALGVGGIPEAMRTLGHGRAVDPGSGDAEFVDAVVETVRAYRQPGRRAALQTAARRLYWPQAREGWTRALLLAHRTRPTGPGFIPVVGGLAGGRTAASLLSALWLVGAARLLGATGFGRLTFLLAAGAVVDVVSDLGIPLTLTHLAASNRADRALVRRAVAMRLAADLPAVVLLVLVYRGATHDGSLAPFVFGASIGASSIYSSYTAVLRGQARIRVESVNEVVSRAGVMVGGLTWLALGGGLLAAVSAYAAADLLSAVVVPMVALRRITWLESSEGGADELRLRSTLPLAAASAVNVLYYRLDIWLLAYISGPVTVAVYAIATRIADVVMLPSRALNSVALAWSERRIGPLNLTGLSLRSMAMTAPLAVVGLMLSPYLIPAALGPEYRAAVGPTRILLVASVLTSVLLAVNPAMAVRRRGLFLTASATALAVNVGANLVLIPRLGANGAALATLGSEALLLGSVVRMWRGPREVGQPVPGSHGQGSRGGSPRAVPLARSA